MKRNRFAPHALAALTALAHVACAPEDASSSSSSMARFGARSPEALEAAIAVSGGGTTTTTPPSYCPFVFNFFKPIDGYQYYSSLTMNPRKDTATSWVMPTTPGRNTLWLYFQLDYPECPPSVSESAMAQYGAVLVDGSATNVEWFHSFGFEVTAYLHVPQAPLTGHTIKVVYPAIARLGQTQHVATLNVNFLNVNPFTYLQRSYTSDRCVNCHFVGANPNASVNPPINHPFVPTPDSPYGCEGCHSPFYASYFPSGGDVTQVGWIAPGAAKDMDWQAMTVLEKCLKTTIHLPTAAALHQHFDTDPRLHWAVESGVRHDGFPAESTAFPHNYNDFLEIADAWIDQGAPCGNIYQPDLFGAKDSRLENDP